MFMKIRIAHPHVAMLTAHSGSQIGRGGNGDMTVTTKR
jgi:hypothetical protein